MNSECFVCQLKRYTGIARELGSDAAATDFAKDMMRVYLSAPEGVDSPWYGPHFAALLEKHFGLPQDSFRAEMEEANAFVRPRLDEIRQRIRAAEDPLLRAIQFSILGNYLDYNSLRGEVSLEKLEQMLLEAEKMELDGKVLAQLRGDLEKGGKLLLITDNAGEIGFDLCLAETVAAQYPGINITFLVRETLDLHRRKSGAGYRLQNRRCPPGLYGRGCPAGGGRSGYHPLQGPGQCGVPLGLREEYLLRIADQVRPLYCTF